MVAMHGVTTNTVDDERMKEKNVMVATSENVIGNPAAGRSRATTVTRWVGRVLTALPTLIMALSALMKLTHNPGLAQTWVSKVGYPESTLVPIGLLELACAIVCIVPRTAALGCILVSCYLAAAVATNVRVGDAGGAVFPLVLGVFAWLGLFLRDERVRALLPLRKGEP